MLHQCIYSKIYFTFIDQSVGSITSSCVAEHKWALFREEKSEYGFNDGTCSDGAARELFLIYMAYMMVFECIRAAMRHCLWIAAGATGVGATDNIDRCIACSRDAI